MRGSLERPAALGRGFGLRTAVLVAVAVLGSSVTGAAAPTKEEAKASKPEREKRCEQLDGQWFEGRWQTDPAPGISIVGATTEQISFTVEQGFDLIALCVETGPTTNVYNSDVQLPVTGPAPVTLTRTERGFDLRAVSFDTEESAGGGGGEVTCPTVDAPEVSFDDPMFIDKQRAGGEPVSIVAQDGSISVSAHAGTTHVYKDPMAAGGARDFAAGYFNQTLNWRSDDGGETWQFIGLFGQREGPHSILSTGFSDPDYTMDDAGNIYNVEIDLANVAVFMSPDDGQSYPISTPFAWAGDRPWLTALEEKEVFLYINQPKFLLRSTDGGITWTPLPSPPVSSKSLRDPQNPSDGLIGPVGSLGRFAVTANDGQTWSTHEFGPRGSSRQFFGVLGVDNAGNVYQAAAGGYGGSNDTQPNGEVSFMYYDRTTPDLAPEDRTNKEKIVIPTPPGDALWPWVIAGDDGRVAVVWYQNHADDPDAFYIYTAVTHNARGTTVTCSDGSTRFIEPQFTVVNASQRPIHLGKICLSGTTCNANPSFEGGDRRLGDFFTVNFDHEGNLFIVSADTTLPSLTGGPKPVGNPIFIKQNAGDLMLEEPMDVRPTRCLWPIPC